MHVDTITLNSLQPSPGLAVTGFLHLRRSPPGHSGRNPMWVSLRRLRAFVLKGDKDITGS